MDKPDLSTMEPTELREYLATFLSERLNAQLGQRDVNQEEIMHLINLAISDIGLKPAQLPFTTTLISRDPETKVFTVKLHEGLPEGVDQMLPVCDREIYDWGEHVYTIIGSEAKNIETWVKQVAERSGQRVDWHNAGNCSLVKATGDIGAVREAIRELEGELRNLGGYGSSSVTEYCLPWTLR